MRVIGGIFGISQRFEQANKSCGAAKPSEKKHTESTVTMLCAFEKRSSCGGTTNPTNGRGERLREY
jgi:hypothetical protein